MEKRWESVVGVDFKFVSFLNNGIICSGFGMWYLCCRSFIVKMFEGVVVMEMMYVLK